KIEAVADESAVLDAEAKEVEVIRAFSLDKLPKDMAVREVKVATFGETVDFVSARLRKISIAKRQIEKQRKDLAPELAARQRALAEVESKAQLEQRVVVVTVESPATTVARKA